MNILKQDNTITFKKFKCLRTNHMYEIVQTECTGRYIINAIDTLVRSDGLRKSFTYKDISKVAEELANDYSSDKKDPVWRDIRQDGIKAIQAFVSKHL